jgi:hypothetical protein
LKCSCWRRTASTFSCDIARAVSREEPRRSRDPMACPVSQLVGVVTQTVSLRPVWFA